MEDLLVQSRFKNLSLADLLRGDTQKNWAQKIGVSEQTITNLLTLNRSPFSKRGNGPSPAVKKISEFFGLPPEEIFPPTLYALKLPRVVERTYDSVVLLPLLKAGAVPPQQLEVDERLDGLLLKKKIGYLLQTLYDETDAKVIRLYFGLGDEEPKTIKEVAKILHISGGRVQQRMNRALRYFRHPTRSNQLEYLVDPEARPLPIPVMLPEYQVDILRRQLGPEKPKPEKCTKCGGRISAASKGTCLKCWNSRGKAKVFFCIDCKEKLPMKTKNGRCHTCYWNWKYPNRPKRYPCRARHCGRTATKKNSFCSACKAINRVIREENQRRGHRR